MKYSLEIQDEEQKKLIDQNPAIIGEDGFGKKTGYVKVYSTIGEQNEYFHATITYVSLHAGIGSDMYLDAPILPDDDSLAVVRSGDLTHWETCVDHRGKIAYRKEDRSEYIIDYLGDIKEDVTWLKPETVFDYWDGDKWVTDKEAQKQDAIQSAKYEKRYRIDRASEIIQPLQDAVDLDMATEEEKIQLRSWKLYRLNLHRKDISTAPDIEWPEKPNQ